jgi:hypothetical protein
MTVNVTINAQNAVRRSARCVSPDFSRLSYTVLSQELYLFSDWLSV